MKGHKCVQILTKRCFPSLSSKCCHATKRKIIRFFLSLLCAHSLKYVPCSALYYHAIGQEFDLLRQSLHLFIPKSSPWLFLKRVCSIVCFSCKSSLHFPAEFKLKQGETMYWNKITLKYFKCISSFRGLYQASDCDIQFKSCHSSPGRHHAGMSKWLRDC